MKTAQAWFHTGIAGLCLLTAFASGGCLDEEAKLVGHTYLLESSRGYEPVDGTTIRLSFAEKGVIGLFAGCNHLAGDFSVDDGRLVTEGLGSTDIGCQAELHTQDEWLSAFITAGPRVELKGDRLTLTGKDATLEFLDREIASPDRPLVGTEWEVDTFIKNGGAGNFPLMRPPTLRFDAQGKVQVFTGCNEGSGSYERKGERLVFSAMQYTEKACADAAGVEQHVQAVVSDGDVGIEIEELRLTLMRGELGLGAIAPK